jgi:hypothetical protein
VVSAGQLADLLVGRADVSDLELQALRGEISPEQLRARETPG